MERPNNRSVAMQVVRLEADVASLTTTVRGVAEMVERSARESTVNIERVTNNLSMSIRAVDEKIDHFVERLGARLDERSRTPWSTLAGWAAVIIVVLGAIGASWVAPLHVADTAMARRIERLEEHEDKIERTIDAPRAQRRGAGARR